MLEMISGFLKFTKASFVTQKWSILENVPCALEKKSEIYIYFFLNEMPCRYQLGPTDSNVSFKACVSLLIFYLDDLSIGVSGVLKFPTIIMSQSISSLIVVSICLMYWGAFMLGAYIFKTVISSSWIDPLIIT